MPPLDDVVAAAFANMRSDQIAQMRRVIRHTYVVQAMAAAGAAVLTWSAIDAFATGSPLWSALYTVIAFANSFIFLRSIETRRGAHNVIALWKKTEVPE